MLQDVLTSDFRFFRVSKLKLNKAKKNRGCWNRDSTRLRNLEDVYTKTLQDSKILRLSRPRPTKTHQKVSKPKVSLITRVEGVLFFYKVNYILTCLNWTGLMHRHAESREPGNLVPGHFWSKIRTFFKNQSFKEITLEFCASFVKKTGSN